MVDLINKDYAEFVNLSTNLVDLDKAISQLKPPLIRIKNDVEIIASEIDSGLCRIRNLLERKREILSKKLLLKHMIGLQEKLMLLETNEALPLRWYRLTQQRLIYFQTSPPRSGINFNITRKTLEKRR
jgi:septal ring factor EnvC (AmiA/AmiB activator)